MDDEQKFIVSESIRDVIRMIDIASIKPDLHSGMMAVQIMNRAGIAHLSIERGIKSLIEDAGGAFDPHHKLNAHYSKLASLNQEAAQFLSASFEDAVQFYNINPKTKGCKHFRELETYLASVGSNTAFQTMRYWELGQSRDDKLLGRFSLTLHSEILRALQQLVDSLGAFATVTQRVERNVDEEMFNRRRELYYISRSIKESDVAWYCQWLNGYSTCCEAMADAVNRKFDVGNELANEVLTGAFNALSQNDDPAVQYFVRTLKTALNLLPKQQWDVVPEVKWVGEIQFRLGIVSTPAGRRLGYIEKRADAYWNIQPTMGGLTPVSDIAQTWTDAACYLADLLTKRVTITVDSKRGELRFVGEAHSLLISHFSRNRADASPSQTRNVEFWDDAHGILAGQTVHIAAPYSQDPLIGAILEGEVTAVDGAKVSVKGTSWMAPMPESAGDGDGSS